MTDAFKKNMNLNSKITELVSQTSKQSGTIVSCHTKQIFLKSTRLIMTRVRVNKDTYVTVKKGSVNEKEEISAGPIFSEQSWQLHVYICGV